MIINILKKILRKRFPIEFADFSRTEPVSRVYGSDRGTSVDRYYIDNFLKANKESIKGNVLEIGESRYSKAYGEDRVDSYEVLHVKDDNPQATIVGDLTDLETLPKNSMDCFIATQTFNFIFDVSNAIEGAHYLLKPGGVLLATVSGIGQISRYDMDRWGDYWRFTNKSLEELFGQVFKGGVQIVNMGNVLTATASLQGVSIEDIADKKLLDKVDNDYQVILGIVAQKEN